MLCKKVRRKKMSVFIQKMLVFLVTYILITGINLVKMEVDGGSAAFWTYNLKEYWVTKVIISLVVAAVAPGKLSSRN